MTHDEAIKRFFKVNLRAQRQLKRLLKWDATKTLRDNAKMIGDTIGRTSAFAYYYALSYRRKNARRALVPVNAAFATQLIREGMPASRIARMYGITRQALDQCLRAKKVINHE